MSTSLSCSEWPRLISGFTSCPIYVTQPSWAFDESGPFVPLKTHGWASAVVLRTGQKLEIADGWRVGWRWEMRDRKQVWFEENWNIKTTQLVPPKCQRTVAHKKFLHHYTVLNQDFFTPESLYTRRFYAAKVCNPLQQKVLTSGKGSHCPTSV